MDGGGVMSSVSALLDQAQDLAFGFEAQSGNFVVVGFGASEAVHTPFEVTLELASDDPNIDLAALMDTPATLSIHYKYDEVRYLNGIITEISRGDSGTRRTFYSVTLHPTLVRLAHGADSRIWQNKTVPEIVAEVLDQYKVADVEWRLAEAHEKREYLTQYNETHLGFITRLLAEEGIFYFFEHGKTSHKLILTDAPLSTPVLEQASKIPYNARTGGDRKGSAIQSFSQHERLRATAYEINDYTFHNPNARMKEMRKRQENNGTADTYALYDYPGRYKNPAGVGQPFIKHRMESVRTDATTGQGVTDNIQLAAGYHFEITDHDDAKANGSHFLLSVTHTGQQSAALEEDAGDAPTTYSASFATMPARLPYRPPIAPKPTVDGPQIAIVTGPEGEEIYTDEHGRIKVWFPWDRHGEQNERSSCWIRVAQNWAGGTWGHMAIPRIGHEVIISYLDGDVDQPIVMGRTYHANNKPPYKLPENKTRMTIKSQTHKGEGYNELRFEDEKDREEVFMHAQKDHNTIIENDESHHIKHDRKKTVDNNQTETIGVNKTISVGGNHDETVTKNADVKVKENLTNTTNGMREDITKKDTTWTVSEGKYTFNVQEGTASYNVKGNVKRVYYGKHIEDTSNLRQVGAKGFHFNTGESQNAETNKIVMQAGEEIKFVTGNSSITLKSDGNIEIAGISIKTTGAEEVHVEGGKINSAASGEHVVAGKILKLN